MKVQKILRMIKIAKPHINAFKNHKIKTLKTKSKQDKLNKLRTKILKIEKCNKDQCQQYLENYQLFILIIHIQNSIQNQKNLVNLFKKTKIIDSKLLEIKEKHQRKMMKKKYLKRMRQR